MGLEGEQPFSNAPLLGESTELLPCNGDGVAAVMPRASSALTGMVGGALGVPTRRFPTCRLSPGLAPRAHRWVGRCGTRGDLNEFCRSGQNAFLFYYGVGDLPSPPPPIPQKMYQHRMARCIGLYPLLSASMASLTINTVPNARLIPAPPQLGACGV